MRSLFLFLLIISCLLAYSQSDMCSRSINGQVLDLDSGEPLSFANIIVVGTNKGAVADFDGHFIIEEICEEEVHIEARFIGYKTVLHHHDFHHGDPVIYLAPDETQLESVIIEHTNTSEIRSIAVQKQEVSKLSVISGSIGGMTEQISGVSLLKTGSNISKPIIHGLHSNRVLVINDGVRHAYQVWGVEHAPEIDPSHVDQIQIVKGAATVKYGPDALGGVILYNSKKPLFDTPFNGSFGSSYKTNGGAVSSQLNLGQGAHRFAWNAGFYGTYQGDMHAPDYHLSNTGAREYGGSFNTLWHQPKFDLQVSGSYFNQELGILRGSIIGNLDDFQNAIDRGVPEPTFSKTYDLQSPKQDTEHGLLKTDLSLFLGDHEFNIQYAIQQNIREEYDVRRGELNDRPVIDLKLISHTLDAEWLQPERGRWTGSSGMQLFTHHSVNEPGSNPVNFVPDYDIVNVGAYTVQALDFDNTIVELGARFDFQNLNVADTIRDVTIYANEVKYQNATFTLGMRKVLNKSLTFYSNIGSAWRPPNVAELYSFGYHHSIIQFGLWRYTLEPSISTPIDDVFDESDRQIPAEKSFKWVSGLEIQSDKTTSELVVYANQINDYIFLRPYGITVGARGTFPYFLYDQTNAFFVGADWDIRYRHSQKITSELKISYVYAVETQLKQAFIGIPPLNIHYGIDYEYQHWNFNLNLNYTAQQWHEPEVIEPIDFQNGTAEVNPGEIFDFMAPPAHYLLVGGNISYNKSRWNVILKASNAFNTAYRSYTDRLRYFADAPGRNVTLAFDYKF